MGRADNSDRSKTQSRIDLELSLARLDHTTASGPEPDVLQSDDTIRMGRKPVELLGNPPQPFVVAEKDVSTVGKVYPRCRRVVVQAKGSAGLVARGGKPRIKIPVAVFAPIEKSIASEPNADVSIGVGTARPDDKGHLVVPIRGIARQSICFEDFDLHVKSGLAHHRLQNLRDLSLQRAIDDRKRE